MKLLLVCVLVGILSYTSDAIQRPPQGKRASDSLMSDSTPPPGKRASDSLMSYLHGARLTDRTLHRRLTTRQEEEVCNTSTDCYPPGVQSAPSSLIECIPGGLCACNDCFTIGSNGTCVDVECEDWTYNQNERKCDDDRPKQLTAFLLSLFLSSTGAANFYIGRNDLAGAQLFLLLFTFFASYVICCLPCCMMCCMEKEDMKGSLCFMLLVVLFIILIVMCMLATWAWWLADLIIFATNQRDAGNGCMLQENL